MEARPFLLDLIVWYTFSMSFLYPIADPFRRGYSHGQWTFYGVRHSGVDDIPIPGGSKYPARSPEDGKITNTGRAGSCGLMIQIKGDSGFTHYMCHFDRVEVSVGQRVKRGQRIGIIGNTSGFINGVFASTQVHLHRVLYDPQGRQRNPDEFTWVHNDVPISDLDKVRKSINGNFLIVFKRQPVKEDNDYFLSRIGKKPPVGINSEPELVNKMKFWAAQPHAVWLRERAKVLSK